MPRDDCRRLDDPQRVRPSPPKSGDDNPESSVDRTEAWTRCRATQDRKLLAKHEVFQDEIRPGTERRERGPGDRYQYSQHAVAFAQFGCRVTVESYRSFG